MLCKLALHKTFALLNQVKGLLFVKLKLEVYLVADVARVVELVLQLFSVVVTIFEIEILGLYLLL